MKTSRYTEPQILARTEVTRLQHLRDAETETFDLAICLGVILVDQVSLCLKSRTVCVTHPRLTS